MLLQLDTCTQTIHTWKLFGILILIIKIIIPSLLIISGIIETSKIVISKEPEKISPSVISFIKKFIAGVLIFFAPVIIYGIIDTLINNRDDSKYYKCTKCLFFPTSDECNSYIEENEKEKEELEDEDFNIEDTSLDTSRMPDANGIISSDYAAIGINGGVRLKIKNKKGIVKYKFKAKDYNGTKYEPIIPDNITGPYEHDFYKYTTNNLDDTYIDIRKLDHRYVKINSWLNKNNEEYQFKIYGYNSSGDQEFESEWLSAIPYNVEKDAPEAEVNLPSLSYMHDPEGGTEGNILTINDNKEIDYNNRLYVTSINEGANSVTIKWKNTIKNLEVINYIIRYKEYYPNNEQQNSNTEFKIETSSEEEITLSDLSTEQEYLVQIVANGISKSSDKQVSTLVEEIVVPHTENSRRSLLKKVKRGNPYRGVYTLNEYCTKGEAEAFANYGNNGSAFESKTNYFIWANMYQFRVYIFQKNKSNEWRLFKDFAIIIGNSERGQTPSGQYNIKGREWTDNGENGYALRYLINYQDETFGNVWHSAGVAPVMSRVVESSNRFQTAGCTIVDLPWLKFLYEYTIGSWMYNDYGD